MTITEKNVAIAEMLGATPEQWYPYNKDTHTTGIYYSFPKGKEGERYHGDTKLKFHSDANWQFEAIDWIEKQEYLVHIDSDYWYNDEVDTIDKSKIQHLCTIHKNYSIIINSAGHGNDRINKKEAIFETLYQFSQYIKKENKFGK